MEWREFGDVVTGTVTLVSQGKRDFELASWNLAEEFRDAHVELLEPPTTPSTMNLR